MLMYQRVAAKLALEFDTLAKTHPYVSWADLYVSSQTTEVHVGFNYQGVAPIVIHMNEESLVSGVSINVDQEDEGQFPWVLLSAVYPIIERVMREADETVEKELEIRSGDGDGSLEGSAI